MQEKIKVKDLVMEIKTALSDEFVAHVAESQEGISLQFTNGQKVVLSVKEN